LKTVLRHIVSHIYKPLLAKYLSKTRTYRYKDIRLEIPPQVFHPGFFFSTQLLLQYIMKLPLHNRTFLELGFGSGLISIEAAKRGATVTATEINLAAVDIFKNNCIYNNVWPEIIHSDLFDDIPIKRFDVIAINPPYYKKQPLSEKDYAWYCGENGEYFSKLFDTMDNYIHNHSEVLMVLFDGCDMEMITGFAAKRNFVLNCVFSKQNILEKNFIFKIEKQDEQF